MNPYSLLAGAAAGVATIAIAYSARRYTNPLLAGGLLLAALIYLGFAVTARTSAGWILVELLGVAIYGGIALRGLRGSVWWLAAGWALHALWDVLLHYVGPGRAFAPAWYPGFCAVWDVVIGVAMAMIILRAQLQRRVQRAPHLAVR